MILREYTIISHLIEGFTIVYGAQLSIVVTYLLVRQGATHVAHLLAKQVHYWEAKIWLE